MNDRREFLRAVKRSAAAAQPTLSIPVGRPVEALLRPAGTVRGSIREGDLRVLSDWRNKYVTAFLTEFEATPERTERWLADHVADDDTRILFMIDDLEGATFGYMGLAFIDWERNSGEADAIVRGRETRPGFMTTALRTLLEWGRNQLRLEELGVRVRSDNPALEFYRKFGFVEIERVPLRRTSSGSETHYIPDPSLGSGEPSLVHMRLQEARSE